MAVSSQRCHPRGAFTLIELMVVIAIVGILAALLLPVLAKGVRKAKGVVCINNLHQIATAVRVHANDRQDQLPRPADSTNLVWQPRRYIGYGRLIKVELDGNAKVFFCPTATFFRGDGTNGYDAVTSTNRAALSSYYQRGGRQGAPGRVDQGGGMRALISDYETASPVTSQQWVNRNHVTGKNVMWTDGSVSWVKNGSDSQAARFGGDSKPKANDGTWGKLDRREQ